LLAGEGGNIVWGGVGTYVNELSQELRARGVEVVIAVSPRYLRDADRSAAGEDIRVQEVDETDAMFAERLSEGCGAGTVLYVQEPALVRIAHHLVSWGAVDSVVAAAHLPAYGGFSYFGEPADVLRLRVAEAQLFRLSSAVVAPSFFVADILRRVHRLRSAHIVVAHLATRRPAMTPRRTEMPFRVLSVGRLVKQKGPLEYRDVVWRLHDSAVHFRYAGSAADRRFEELARVAGVQLLGQLSSAELSAEFDAAHVLLSTSLHETFGLAVLEGMAHGVVPVAFGVGSLPEIICHGVNGFLSNTASPRALATYLELLMNDRGLHEQMAAAAAERAREFTWDRHISRLAEGFQR
jgi:glycosyltransferase involved in cell wall biosynthesis